MTDNIGSAEPIHVYGLPATLESIHAHLLDGLVYPDLAREVNDTLPSFRSHSVEPDVAFETLGYTVKPVARPTRCRLPEAILQWDQRHLWAA